jgi:hypothetical protein
MVIIVEKNYANVFDVFPTFFKTEIKQKWEYIMHDSGNDFYIESLVQEFYNSFAINDIDYENGRILLHWRGNEIIFGVNEIAAVTKLTIQDGNQQHGNLELYRPLMGNHCTTPADGGLSGHTLYRNVYATCRLLGDNVAPTSHVSSFYEDTLHIVHMLMLQDKNFCMVRRLFDSIAGVKIANSSTLKLPCLVTALCQHILPDAEFVSFFTEPLLVPKKVRITAAFHTSYNEDWTPKLMQENVTNVEAEILSDDEFFSQSPPTDPKDFRVKTWEGIRRMWGSMGKMHRKLDRLIDSLTCTARTDADVSPRSRSRSRSRSLSRSRSVAGEGSSSRPR